MDFHIDCVEVIIHRLIMETNKWITPSIIPLIKINH